MSEPRTPVGTWLLTISGIASILLIDNPATPYLLTAMSILAVWAVMERRTSARLPKTVGRAADLVVATGVVGLATTHFAFGKASLPMLCYVLVIGQLSRAFRRKRSRDLAVMHGTAMAQLCLAAFLTTQDAYLPLFIAAVIFGVAASLALPGVTGVGGDDARVFVGRPRGRAGLRAKFGSIVQPVLLGAVLLACGAAFFVLLPRGAPFMDEEEVVAGRQEIIDPNDYSDDVEDAVRRITGFSEEVKLGEVGLIKHVPWQAFQAQLFIRGRPSRLPNWLLYWRGAVLDTFTGTEWTRSPEMLSREKWMSTRGGPGVLGIREGVPESQAGFRTVSQTYYMKATTSTVLFALDAPIHIELSSVLPKVRRLGPHCLAAPLPHAEAFSYSVTSCVPSDPEQRILVEDLPNGEARPYLAVPPDVEAISRLAQSIAGDGQPIERAHRLIDWLKENCEYTLLFTERPAGTAIEHFLLTTRAGHCEYFASALAIMLRSVGIPSRLVVGYRGGQWLEDDELYFVRQSDAHAWVEAHFRDRGWVRFDPTPGDENAVHVEPSRVPGMLPPEPEVPLTEEMLDFVQDFGPEERKRLLAGVGTAVTFVAREGFGVGRPERSWPPPLLVLCGAGAVLFLGLRGWRRLPRLTSRRRREKHSTGLHAPPRATFYEEAVRNVSRRGVIRRLTESPREYARLAAPVLQEDAPIFREITGAFERVRYGVFVVTADEEARLLALAQTLRPVAPVEGE